MVLCSGGNGGSRVNRCRAVAFTALGPDAGSPAMPQGGRSRRPCRLHALRVLAAVGLVCVGLTVVSLYMTVAPLSDGPATASPGSDDRAPGRGASPPPRHIPGSPPSGAAAATHARAPGPRTHSNRPVALSELGVFAHGRVGHVPVWAPPPVPWQSLYWCGLVFACVRRVSVG